MTGSPTARPFHVSERRKARARLFLLTLLAAVCWPLAGVRSLPLWIAYTGFALLYSLWARRLVRNFGPDRRVGYLLVLTDTAVLLPLLVWASSAVMQVFLVMVCVIGLVTTYWADRLRTMSAGPSASSERVSRGSLVLDDSSWRLGAGGGGAEAALEAALRLRLELYEAIKARFALVILRVVRFEETIDYYGEEAAAHLLSAVGRRGSRLLGPDAQQFILPGGRVAFVFGTGSGCVHYGCASSDCNASDLRADRPAGVVGGQASSYDVESIAMALGRKVSERLVDGHRVECVVGWASAPADGLSVEDLVYTAERGAQSTAAFRRVGGPVVPVPDRSRAAAG